MRQKKRRPVHPGRIIKNHHMEPLALTVTHLSEILGVSRKTASKVVNERASITPDMALRLSRAFNTTPDLWLGLQKSFDLWNAERESAGWKKVKPVKPDPSQQSRSQG